MRLGGVPADADEPIRCDLIGSDFCPTPSDDVLGNATLPVAYGMASIYGKHGSQVA